MAVKRGLADTSLFIARESGLRLDEHRLPDEIAVSVVTVGELRAGVLSAETVDARDRRLRTLAAAMTLEPVPIDEDVAAAWATLRTRLRDAGQRIPLNASWIAATAMRLDVPVVTQDDDFVAVDGLVVITA